MSAMSPRRDGGLGAGGGSEAKKPPSKHNNKKHGFCFFSDKRLKYQTVSCLITFTVNHAACPADPQSR